MTADRTDLLQAYLDDTLTSEQEAELNAWVKRGPDNARALAAAMLLHDRLRNEIRAGREIGSAQTQAPVEPLDHRRNRRAWRPMMVLGALATAGAMMLVLLWWVGTAPLNAATELDRLIDRSATGKDRTYRITSLDEEPEAWDDRRPPLDGATLHVRSPDSYVLIRRFPDGEQFVTGSDGEESWSIRPRGAVRVSQDPLRFRGPLPGHQHGIPFVDLRSDLVRLRDAYTVTVLGPGRNGWRGLLARKMSPAFRGPNRIELWYDARTGILHRMMFEGMPRARGGPNRLAVELLDQRNLSPQFFHHAAHHAPDRQVIEEAQRDE